MKTKFIFLASLFLSLAYSSSANLIIPKIIGHNMVLQQHSPVPIWGWTDKGEKVTVTFKNQTKTTTADNMGNWRITLEPMESSFDEATLTIATSKDQVVLKNILVGEVWFCSGQSNMEFAMRKLVKLKLPEGAKWPVNEVAEAKNKSIRIFLVERKKMNPDSSHTGWAEAMDPALNSFSAVGYFFAKEIFAKLKVPVGVISASIPGSGIEPWMPSEAMLQEPFFENGQSKDTMKRISSDAGKFYTTMIEPVIPFAIKGFLWYQGENNCFLNERLQYSYKMKALINYWRYKWNHNELPFYYVQIAPYYYSKANDKPYTVYSEPEFWEAQSVVLKMPNTAMIATIDLIENPKDLHPVNKWDVGKRLAASVLSSTYKVNSMPFMGPVFKSAQKKQNSFVLSFDYVGSGLKSKDGKPLSYFEIEDAQGGYHPAVAVVKDNKVWVHAENVKSPKSVRFGWREDAVPNLINAEGLPALPFRTNNPLIDLFK